MQIGIDDMKLTGSDARSKYEVLKPNSREIRDAWIEKRAIDKYGDGNTVLGNIISRMRRIEELRDSHREIKDARGKLMIAGTKKLVIPNSSND